MLEHLPGVAAFAACRFVEHLGEVGKIDDPPLPRAALRDPRGDRLVVHDLGGQRRHALLLEHGMEAGHAVLHLLENRLIERADRFERVPEENRGCHPPGPARVARPLHRLEQDAEIGGHLARHHARRARRHGRNGEVVIPKPLGDRRALGVRLHEDTYLARPKGPGRSTVVGTEGRHGDHLVHLPHRRCDDRRGAGVQKLDRPQALEPRLLATRGRIDRAIRDARSEVDLLHDGVEAVEQRLV